MIYEYGSVSVDRDFARFGGRSFAISQINSVEVRAIEQIAWLKLLGVLLGLVSAFSFFLLLGGAGIGAVIVGVLFLIAAVRAWLADQSGARWQLFLTTSSGQAQAYEADNPEEVTYLRDAIEQAMAAPALSPS